MTTYIQTGEQFNWTARDFERAAGTLGAETCVLLKTIALLGRGQTLSAAPDAREDYYIQGLAHAAVVLSRAAAGLAERAQVEALAETVALVERFGGMDDREPAPAPAPVDLDAVAAQIEACRPPAPPVDPSFSERLNERFIRRVTGDRRK